MVKKKINKSGCNTTKLKLQNKLQKLEKNLIVTKFKISNLDQTQQLNCDSSKTQILVKLFFFIKLKKVFW